MRTTASKKLEKSVNERISLPSKLQSYGEGAGVVTGAGVLGNGVGFAKVL